MRILYTAALAASLSVPALAQERPPTTTPPPEVIDFQTDLEVQGEIVRPQGLRIDVRQSSRFPPMIELRADFADAMRDNLAQIR